MVEKTVEKVNWSIGPLEQDEVTVPGLQSRRETGLIVLVTQAKAKCQGLGGWYSCAREVLRASSGRCSVG